MSKYMLFRAGRGDIAVRLGTATAGQIAIATGGRASNASAGKIFRDIQGGKILVRRQDLNISINADGRISSFSSKQASEISKSIADSIRNKTNLSLDKSDLGKTRGYQVKIFPTADIPRFQIIDYRRGGTTSTFALKTASRIFKQA